MIGAAAVSMDTKRLLIVEDDIESCKILNVILAPHELTVVHTIASAKPYFQSQQFDIYMLDNWLPDGSGIDLCREIRSHHPDTPIIFTSAAALTANVIEATEAGATRYITKPFDPFELEAVVKELLQGHAPHTAG